MTETLTNRTVIASGLPAQLATLLELSWLLDRTVRHIGLVDSQLQFTIRELRRMLRKAGITIDYEVARKEPNFGVKLLTIPELQGELGISRGTLMKVRRSPDFPKAVRISGRKLAYLSSEVRAWVEGGGLGSKPPRRP